MKKIFAALLSALMVLGVFSVCMANTYEGLEKLEYSYQDGVNVSFDMDGDGKDDKIVIRENEYNQKQTTKTFKINDAEIISEPGSYWINEVYFGDLNKSDKTKELFILYGYHSNSWCQVLRYENNALKFLSVRRIDSFDNEMRVMDDTTSIQYVTDDGKYIPNIEVKGDGTLTLFGKDNDLNGDDISEKYIERERGILEPFDGNFSTGKISDADVDWKTLYKDKINEIKGEYKNGKRAIANPMLVNTLPNELTDEQLDNFLFFSVQDINFDGVPELYYVECNRFENEYSSIGEPEIYYIKDGKVEKGDANGVTNLTPGYAGHRPEPSNLKIDNWQNVMKNTETGEVNFIVYNGFSAFAEYPKVVCYKLFFDAETGTLYSDCLINQEANEYTEKQRLTGYEYMGTEVYFNTAPDEQWNIWNWKPSYIAPKVIVNETTVEFDRPPVIVSDRTLVPIRKIAEALGAEVQWNGAENKALIFTDERKIELKIDDKNYTVDGNAKAMDVPARLFSGRTYVPARAVAEALECRVDWNGDTQTVIITK